MIGNRRALHAVSSRLAFVLRLSIICMVLLSASTPFNAALLLIGFAINHYIFT